MQHARLRTARNAAGLTQEAVATFIGVTRAAVSSWEREPVDIKSSHLASLARLYGRSEEYLRTGRQDANAEALIRSAQANQKEGELLELFKVLDERGQSALLDIARTWSKSKP